MSASLVVAQMRRQPTRSSSTNVAVNNMYQRSTPHLIPCVTTTPAADEARYVEHLRSEIARHEAACGCELGSVFTLAALVVFVGGLVVHDSDWSTVGTIGRGVLWVVGCSVVGKLLGLAWARLRLIRVRVQLRFELRASSYGPTATNGPFPALGRE
jgi:hypothetical protein